MTIIYIRNSFALNKMLNKENTYFIVEQEINLESLDYTLGAGSIIEFVDTGKFIGAGETSTSLNLNGGQVIAAESSPIFSKIKVTGFGNDKIYAEWFYDIDLNNTAAHAYINKALIAAKGCPVVLTKKEYMLTGSIVFPSGTPSTLCGNVTLILDIKSGNNVWNTNPVAILINTSNVTINIDKIIYPLSYNEIEDIDKYNGTGIKILGEVLHLLINVNKLWCLKHGIDITPGRKSLLGTFLSGNMRYMDITFQHIIAEYCIYINVFDKNIGDPSKNQLTRSVFHGGRLQGKYGVYIKEPEAESIVDDTHISELRFTNIGFEGFSNTPIRLCKATRLKFEYIRMAESLPEPKSTDIPWIVLNDVSWTSFSINGDLRVYKYVAFGKTNHITIKGCVYKDTDSSETPFDIIMFNSLKINDGETLVNFPQKVAACTVQPFQITQTSTDTGYLQDQLPVIIPQQESKFAGLSALPCFLQFYLNEDTYVNVDGLWNFAPCIYYFKVRNTSSNQNLILTAQDESNRFYYYAASNGYFKDDYLAISSKQCKILKDGLYKLVWVIERAAPKIMVTHVE